MKFLFSFALAALLAGCWSRAAQPGGDFAVPHERLIFLALKEIQATDQQRLAVMAAYDEARPRQDALVKETQILLEQWRKLNRRDPEFRQQADKVSTRLGEVLRERSTTMALYEARIVVALDAERWEVWREFWDDLALAEGRRR